MLQDISGDISRMMHIFFDSFSHTQVRTQRHQPHACVWPAVSRADISSDHHEPSAARRPNTAALAAAVTKAPSLEMIATTRRDFYSRYRCDKCPASICLFLSIQTWKSLGVYPPPPRLAPPRHESFPIHLPLKSSSAEQQR